MIFDTDILIWIERGNKNAIAAVEKESERVISIQSYLELIQGCRNQTEQNLARSFLTDMGFIILPYTESIGHRAAVYIEEYSMSHGLRAADAIIAATAIEANLQLLSSNGRHFKAVRELKFRIFKPD